MGTALDLDDVQGNILNGYGSCFGYAVHLLLHADTAEAARTTTPEEFAVLYRGFLARREGDL